MVNSYLLFTSNPPLDIALKAFLILAGTFFSVRYVLIRRTWTSPVIFVLLTAALILPIYYSVDLWSEVSSLRHFLLAIILSFFAVSPVLEWLEQKRIEAEGQRRFRQSARDIQLAFEALAREKIGALLAIEREDSLDPIARKGIPVNGEITKEVLATFFTPYTPTHDGGIIIRDKKIAACGCVFPLSGNEHMSKDLGTRHRAALGLAEKTDALVLVASEESGEVSVATYGKLEHNISPDKLAKKIIQELGRTHHKNKVHFPILAQRRLRITKQGSCSTTSLSRKILLLTGAAFFAALFASFFPDARNLAWLNLHFVATDRWGWIDAIPLLASLALTLRVLDGNRILFYPDIREVERNFTFLGIGLLRRRYAYDSLKGLNIFSSRKWRNLYELRLAKNRFASWLVTESKNVRKLEDTRLVLDPPRPASNFGVATSSSAA